MSWCPSAADHAGKVRPLALVWAASRSNQVPCVGHHKSASMGKGQETDDVKPWISEHVPLPAPNYTRGCILSRLRTR